MIKIEIFWADLTEKAQKEMAEILGEPVEEIAASHNWDAFPMCTFEMEKEE
jgi:hypothetical protein